ncbi:MAG: hypothetical protein HOY69_35320, partial [Streptomyces sp.]|nr:hypothetical protein [Streptomyces sp.]
MSVTPGEEVYDACHVPTRPAGGSTAGGSVGGADVALGVGVGVRDGVPLGPVGSGVEVCVVGAAVGVG